MNDTNERKRKLETSSTDLPLSKKRKLNMKNEEDDNSDLEQLINERVEFLNKLYTKLIKHIRNKKSYEYYKNIYKNEEFDLKQLVHGKNITLDKYNFNHVFANLPLDNYFENTKDVDDEMDLLSDTDDETNDDDNDSDYTPSEISSEYTDSDVEYFDQGTLEITEDFKNILASHMLSSAPVPINIIQHGELPLVKNKNDDLVLANNTLTQEEKKYLLEENRKIELLKNNLTSDKLKILQLDVNIETKYTILQKFELLEKSHQDDIKTREWINNVMKLPFGKYALPPIKNIKDNGEIKIFLKNFHSNMNNTIYGQNEVKETLMEIVTKWLISDNQKGNCIAIEGAAGVGKTSLARSLAKSLDRPFCSFSLAGVSDENYLSGFSFTYEGATCGRFAKMLMDSKCMNPIIFMDELDKVDTKKSLSVFNKLIEITDFSQNHEIEDHYFGSSIKLDMSKCIFIFSLNNINLIDPILRDRLEVISAKSFNTKDKVQISNKFLIPQLLKEYSINKKYFITDENIRFIVNNIQKESGVRNLKRSLDQIFRKLNMLQYYDEDLSYKLSNSEVNNIEITKKIIGKLLPKKNTNDILLKMYI